MMQTIGRKRQSLESWIGEAILDTDKPSPCSHLALMHVQGGAPLEIYSKVISTNMDIPALAELFKAKAESYSQDLSGAQTFQLLAFYGSKEPGAIHPFVLTGLPSANGLPTEGPDSKGEKLQAMRHLENSQALLYRQNYLMFEMQAKENEMMSIRMQRLVQENHDAFEIVRSMLMEKVTAQHELEMKRLQFERATVERQKLLNMVPALANTVLGSEVFPQSSEDTALIEAIAEHITPQNAQAIGSSLPPQILGPLMARLSKYNEKKEAEAKRLRELGSLSTLEGEGLQETGE